MTPIHVCHDRVDWRAKRGGFSSRRLIDRDAILGALAPSAVLAQTTRVRSSQRSVAEGPLRHRGTAR